jgi:hypothetical protein
MADGRRADLDHFLAELVQSLERAAEAMESSYFAPQVAQRSFLTPADAGRSRTTQPLMP